MDDSEFDRSFADKLRQTSAPDFSKEDWPGLSAQLNVQQGNNFKKLLAATTALLLLLLFSSNLFWWNQLENIKHQLSDVEAKIQSPNVIAQPLHTQDTIRIKEIVYHYDTIYRTLLLSPATISPALTNDKTTTAAVSEHDHIATQNAPGSRDGISTVSGQNSPAPGQISTLNLPISRAAIRTRHKNILIPTKEFIALAKKKKPATGQILTPKNISIGAGGGFLLPTDAYLSQKSGYSTTLGTEIGFSDHLALTVDASYMGFYFEGTDNAAALDLPSPSNPDVNDVLKYYTPEEGAMPVFQLATGMRFYFQPQKRCSPYFGAGYAVQWRLPFELQFEYLNSLTGAEKELSVEVENASEATSLLSLNAGVRYRLKQRFQVKAGGIFQHKPDKNQAGFAQVWGIQSGLFYQF
ncbi:MAG: hypothetical protein JNN28_21965 [Saprospiraceae bacterium]|nr:hypothetical protein [Saprospiraceae bacterium]